MATKIDPVVLQEEANARFALAGGALTREAALLSAQIQLETNPDSGLFEKPKPAKKDEK